MSYKTAIKGITQLTIACALIFGTLQHHAQAAETNKNQESASVLETISGDYKNFYAGDRLLRMGVVFGAGAVMANTNIDTNMRNWYQDKVRNEQTDAWSSEENNNAAFRAKLFGEGKYMVPVALLAASVNLINEDTPVGNWGASASRAYIVGLPAAWGMQFATGAARPSHNAPAGSAWRPFNSDGYAHGVSGHAFVGAVPFITIAYMNQDNPWVKYSAYAASTAAALSRVNDDAHFPSQVMLGWYLAWESVDAVFESKQQKNEIKVAPMAGLDGFGMMAKGSW